MLIFIFVHPRNRDRVHYSLLFAVVLSYAYLGYFRANENWTAFGMFFSYTCWTEQNQRPLHAMQQCFYVNKMSLERMYQKPTTGTTVCTSSNFILLVLFIFRLDYFGLALKMTPKTLLSFNYGNSHWHVENCGGGAKSKTILYSEIFCVRDVNIQQISFEKGIYGLRGYHPP